MDRVIAIVVTYNGEKWINKCLSSLIASEIPLQIIVIDNASSDSTVKIIEQDYPEVELIKSEINLGFGKGNNIGLRKAINENADYVFLLNQDAWIEPKTINKLVKIHKENNQFGILSPFHFDYEKSKIEYYFSTIINPFDCPDIINDIYFKTFKIIYEIKFIHAACWLISRDCLQKVGGFDPVFPLYCEDNDYIIRTNYFKFKIGVCPEVFVMHKGTHKGLTELDENFQLKFNFIILHLKNINFKLRGLVITNLKGLLDKITSAFLYRRFKDFKMNIKLMCFSLLKLNEIYKRRKICKEEGAYLFN
jgi:GT2 family glycosyltransferase